MPGIYGIVNSKKSTADLEKMADAMSVHNHFVQDEFFDDQNVAASRTHTGLIGEHNMPINMDHYALWLEGEAYNLKEVSQVLEIEAMTLSGLLLICEKKGILDKCLKLLDGYFCAVIYNQKNQKIKLISDRYGMRFLYWYHKNGLFIWGSEVKALLAISNLDKQLDLESYDCFMDLGYLMGEHTWFEYVKLIKPATVIEYDIALDLASHKHYWKWSEISPSRISFDEAVDQVGKRFIEAVKCRFNPDEKVGISLSGGLDSRAILAALDELYPDYDGYAYTFGIPDCDEITIAEKVIGKALNWEHEKFHFSADNWFDPRKDKVWNTDGMQDMKHMHGSEFLPSVRDKININLNGYCGDLILGGGFLSSVPWNKRINNDNAKSVYGKYGGLTDIESDFYDINYVEPNLLMNRARRFTAHGTVNLLPWVEQRKPFFDNKLVELIFSLPDDYRANNRIYSAMLQKFFPKYFNDIPWHETGKPVAIAKKSSVAFRALRKVFRNLKNLVGIKSTHNYTNYPEWIRDDEIASKLTRLLCYQDSQYKDLTHQDVNKKYVEQHLKFRVMDKSDKILRAATIELYLKQVNKLT